jgi:hypothetical protein
VRRLLANRGASSFQIVLIIQFVLRCASFSTNGLRCAVFRRCNGQHTKYTCGRLARCPCPCYGPCVSRTLINYHLQACVQFIRFRRSSRNNFRHVSTHGIGQVGQSLTRTIPTVAEGVHAGNGESQNLFYRPNLRRMHDVIHTHGHAQPHHYSHLLMQYNQLRRLEHCLWRLPQCDANRCQ